MNDLQDFWNKNSARIPDDKGESLYAVEKEQLMAPGAVVCDLGGGTGTDSLYFIEKGHPVVLVDIADEPLAKAVQHAKEHGVADKLTTVQCDFSHGAIPVTDASCDVVYSRLALHYFESQTLAQLFAEVYRILRPNGWACLTLKSPDDTVEMDFLNSTAVETEEGVFDDNGRVKTRYTITRLKEILSQAGIAEDNYSVIAYTEKLGNDNDIVKSGKSEFIVNEVTIKI